MRPRKMQPLVIPHISISIVQQWRSHVDATMGAAEDFAKAMIPRFRDVHNGLINGSERIAEAMRELGEPETDETPT